ncbi:signal transduction histidine kinase [Rhodobacter sp. JA431]|uniref:hybrid sensor histidine kinase/response regulator n=1 Tax=Rhodobacter sp. JA431 TaxID=570013 RepID=UPI000BCAA484|nr:PAS-domain containing protein [Rhodobacter sp. JA431]SOC21101.1 signal transduction histidine kinase [Rhodobacter sp. JA431]
MNDPCSPPVGLNAARALLDRNDPPERQTEKLLTIVEALIRRAEETTEDRGAAWAQFQRAAMLEDQVRDRTRDLERALDLLNASNARLAKAHRETEAARQNLASAIETIQEGFALFDANDVMVLCNSRFNALLPDIRAQMQPGLSFTQYIDCAAGSAHLGMPPGMNRADWRRMRLARHQQHHFILTQQMGEDRWVQVSEHRTHEGGTVILQTEVTDLVRRERAARGQLRDDQAAVLRPTLEHLKIGVCQFDLRLHLLVWNDRLVEFLKLTPGAVWPGMHFDEILTLLSGRFTFPGGQSVRQLSDWVRRAQRPETFQMEVTREGSQVYEIFAKELPDGGFVLSLEDITQMRTTLAELSRANETLEARVTERTWELEDALASAERANASRARFVAAASHDLLQPLSAAKLYLASLGDDALTEAAGRTLDKAQNALMSVEGILGALLDISRLESGRAAIEPAPLALGPVFRQLADEFAPAAALKGLRLRIRPTEAMVISDRAYLRRILQNLISNALRYTETGSVLVAARKRGGQWRVEVRDSGLGIAEAEQELIFREFHRVDAHASASEGMGLGLAIVDRAAALLGHPLSLQSAPGRGSTFALDFAVACKQPSQEPEADAAMGRDPEAGDVLVLLVENDPELSRAMVQLLEKWGASVLDVSSGEEALDLIASTGVEPDRLLIDYQLGSGIDGLECLQKLQDMLGQVPARLVTADRSEEMRARAKALGVRVLQKPTPTDALEEFLFGAVPARKA